MKRASLFEPIAWADRQHEGLDGRPRERATMKVLRTFASLLSLALLGGLLLPAPSGATIPGANGKFLFFSSRDGVGALFRMNPNGSSQQQVSTITNTGGFATYSPDGKKIVFTSNRDEVTGEIYIMNANGSGVTRLTINTATDDFPAWSPNGRRIAFASDRDGDQEIYTMNRFGGAIEKLTHNSDPDDDFDADVLPHWSPDGKHIVFTTNRDGNSEIYRMRTDGSGQQNLTNDSDRDETAMFSPDGKRIVFGSDRDADFDVYTMNATGGGVKQLTNSPGEDRFGVWSPDGRKIAFHSRRDDPEDDTQSEIYVMNADGSNPVRLTNVEGSDVSLDWLANPVARSLTLRARKDSVAKGRKVTLAGELSSKAPSCEPNQSVILQVRPAKGGRFSRVAQTRSNNKGAYQFSVRVKKSKIYRSSASVFGSCKVAKSGTKTVRIK